VCKFKVDTYLKNVIILDHFKILIKMSFNVLFLQVIIFTINFYYKNEKLIVLKTNKM